MTVNATFVWTNDSGAGTDDRLRFWINPEDELAAYQMSNKADKTILISCRAFGGETQAPFNVTLLTMMQKLHCVYVAVCLPVCLSIGSVPELLSHVCVHLSVSSLTADQNTHSA